MRSAVDRFVRTFVCSLKQSQTLTTRAQKLTISSSVLTFQSSYKLLTRVNCGFVSRQLPTDIRCNHICAWNNREWQKTAKSWRNSDHDVEYSRLGAVASRLFTTSFKSLLLQPAASYSTRARPVRTSLAPLLSSKSRRRARGEELPVPASKAVVGFAVKDEFNLTKLYEKIQVGLCPSESSEPKRLYEPMTLDEELEDSVLYARAIYQHNEGVATRDVFFFADGAVVFWNMAESEQKAILKVLDSVTESEDPQTAMSLGKSERDFLIVNPSTNDKITSVSKKGRVTLREDLDEEGIIFAKYAISNALAQSVKLGVWEQMLETYIDSIEHIAEDLRMGRDPKLTQRDVLVKTGEFFALKHLINLDSDLLDVPDFYWDRAELEKIYQNAFAHFNIGKRTAVMNERLAHCVELTEMMSTNLNHKHGARLETIIIWLIAVEVGIEFLHLFEKYVIEKKETRTEEPELAVVD